MVLPPRSSTGKALLCVVPTSSGQLAAPTRPMSWATGASKLRAAGLVAAALVLVLVLVLLVVIMLLLLLVL